MGLSSDLIFKIYIKTKYNQGHIWLYHSLENINLFIEVVHYGVLLNFINWTQFSQNRNIIIIESMIKLILIIRNKFQNL